MGNLASLREITYLAIVVRIVTATVIGGIIGLERGNKNRPAGLRTYMLVCVGSCLIMLTNQYVYQVGGTGDPVRLGAQVVSGIGFLGAGTIMVTKRNQIKGLTTAAGLWSTAGIGLALGIGFYEAALTAGVAIYFILTVLQRWDEKMHQNAKVLEVYIEHSEEFSLGGLIQQIRNLDVEVDGIQLEGDASVEEGTRALISTLRLRKKSSHPLVLKDIRKIDGVIYAEEL